MFIISYFIQNAIAILPVLTASDAAIIFVRYLCEVRQLTHGFKGQHESQQVIIVDLTSLCRSVSCQLSA